VREDRLEKTLFEGMKRYLSVSVLIYQVSVCLVLLPPTPENLFSMFSEMYILFWVIYWNVGGTVQADSLPLH
jgi:hypothetical protein